MESALDDELRRHTRDGMQIHYLINGLNGGGAAFPIPDLVAHMRGRGHQVRVLALQPQDRRSCAWLDRAGIEWQVLGRRDRDWFGAARALHAELDRDRPDLIWTSLTGATVYGQVMGATQRIPVVSWQHNAFLRPGNRRLLQLTRSLTDFWVADSQSVVDFSVRTLGLEPSRVMRWPIFRARDDAKQARTWTAGTSLRIGSLGRLHPNKRYDQLIEAVAAFSARAPALAARVEFVVGGSGEEFQRLTAQVRARGLEGRVNFVGFVDDTEAFLAGLDGYIQTSHHEGMCIAAHEAMQAGLPVICTAVGELQYSVEPGRSGWLVPIDDVDATATAIAALAANPQAAAQMGRYGRERLLERFGAAAFRRAGDAVLSRAEALVAQRAQ
ncbi:glycosyltransferase [Solimonas marina]|uniref:Glycosyltransferase n=1 Tax=Solimonas marina TaxID=2714601 RepID=A0A969WAC0_9GAMM|nr:glycosyltransferase [Solimonas marina]NKF22814.1 glycosyltransferase [Solimonas marina]